MRGVLMAGGLGLAATVLAAAFLAPAGAAAVASPNLVFPLDCVIGKTCEVQHYVDRDPAAGVLDYRCGHRTYDAHNGVDLRIPDMAAQQRGVNVLAAAPGRVSRLRDGVADISIRAPGAPKVAGQECGNGVVVDHGGGLETQYCHLARGSIRVKVGDAVTAGQPLARVGLSGNTEFPHLHFTVRRGGQIVDPFAPRASTGCKAQESMWSAAAQRQMAYKAGAVMNAGFSTGQVSMAEVEGGVVAPASRSGAYLSVYVRAIELTAGDVLELKLRAPDGGILAEGKAPPLEQDKAQQMWLVGKKRPATGWGPGTYTGEFRVYRAGRVAMERKLSVAL